MKITNIDTLIEEFRNGRDIWSRTAIELAVREIERLKQRVAVQEDLLRLAEGDKQTISEVLTNTIARRDKRIAELEEALTKIARCQSLRFRLSPYEYGLLEQIIGIAEHALKGDK